MKAKLIEILNYLNSHDMGRTGSVEFVQKFRGQSGLRFRAGVKALYSPLTLKSFMPGGLRPNPTRQINQETKEFFGFTWLS
ncbi:hypothetical protein ACTXT7_017355 [Hymenolepis weldensis]